MSDSFLMNPRRRPAPEPKRRKVLVTGAAGNIGSYFARHGCDRYELTLMVRPGETADSINEFGTCVEAELADLDGLKDACRGIDTVVHLAASARPDTVWDELLANNIVGTYNLFVAAHAAGCRRVIFASSIHAVSGYPVRRQVHADDPVNPGDLYGVSKCFGESMGRYMAQQQGLSCIVLRIGAFQPLEQARKPENAFLLDAFVSERDMHQLLCRCIDDEDLQFAIFNGLSGNTFNRMDISEARELIGYEPQDDLSRENPLLQNIGLDVPRTHSEQDGQKPGIREQL